MDVTQANKAEEVLLPREETGPSLKLPKKKKKWIKWAFLAVVAVVVLWWMFLRPKADPSVLTGGQYIPVSALRQDLTISVDGSGAVTPIESYQVSALTSGEILQAPFEVGDWIEQGALLYQLDAKEAQAAIAQAELALRQAQLSYDTVAAGLTARASASGVVQTIHVQKGDLVSPGTPIADITDTSTMLLSLPFQSADAASITPGESAQVTLSGTLETLPGTVESVSSADLVGAGGALVRQVQIRVSNPGALTTAQSATATIGEFSCAGSGNFQANSRQTVTAQASGEITDLYVTVGSKVTAGAAVAAIGGEGAQNSLSNAAMGVESAQLSLQRAQDALENYTITSPISGTVIEKNFKAGDKLDGMESGALAVIFDLSSLKLPINVSELNISQLHPGQKVEITAEALPDQVFYGVVDAVSINGTTTKGFTTYPVTIVLEEFGDLNPGMNVSAKVIISQETDALCIPVSAVDSDGTVLVAGPGTLSEDGSTVVDLSKAQRRTVTLGSGDQEYVSVTNGLEEGEVVLVPVQSTAGLGTGSSTAVVAAGG
ncbi:efflux RND transporter periplasmic adaptor subunit [Lawsonibacter sp. LCP25S3_G6]|uniref:efflux RND transporter periplasmic adaptor subunit n=1 Tax=unclassified Lawsonibacter TaxID=2617946 RepID=UPI003F9DDA91